ncbi:MAG: DegT/DnrJ/EryC1/StrS family aminotransferase [Kiritimatiellia bacterium]|nr:DegT/DnrJ/EryC1/StrS family aminotransferase [Kiritimatiellia bacterium]
MSVPLLDLKRQYAGLREAVEKAVRDVFESQNFILGAAVETCEREVAAYCGCSHGIGMSSGTDALLACLMAEGIGPGDEVITTPYTFFATAGSIARVGARPVFVDIDPATFNLRPDQVLAAITSRTRAILPVHLYGQIADMDPWLSEAASRGIAVIEDACQSIGAESNGRRACSLGDYGCLSFFPTKNLGGAGDGGMVVTRDASKAERLRKLRNHGMEPKYHHGLIGGNFRLDALQAVVVSVKLPHLDRWTEARQVNARRYERLFREAGLTGRGDSPVVLPDLSGSPGHRHVINQYVIRARSRDGLRAHLAARGIGVEIYYPIPLHRQECFLPLGYAQGDFPESERAAQETLALPVFPELTHIEAQTVVAEIREYYASSRRGAEAFSL